MKTESSIGIDNVCRFEIGSRDISASESISGSIKRKQINSDINGNINFNFFILFFLTLIKVNDRRWENWSSEKNERNALIIVMNKFVFEFLNLTTFSYEIVQKLTCEHLKNRDTVEYFE